MKKCTNKFDAMNSDNNKFSNPDLLELANRGPNSNQCKIPWIG